MGSLDDPRLDPAPGKPAPQGEVPLRLPPSERSIPGAELETVLESIEQADRGEVYPLEEVMPELFRGVIPARKHVPTGEPEGGVA